VGVLSKSVTHLDKAGSGFGSIVSTHVPGSVESHKTVIFNEVFIMFEFKLTYLEVSFFFKAFMSIYSITIYICNLFCLNFNTFMKTATWLLFKPVAPCCFQNKFISYP
jgi:hypothetical protein